MTGSVAVESRALVSGAQLPLKARTPDPDPVSRGTGPWTADLSFTLKATRTQPSDTLLGCVPG